MGTCKINKKRCRSKYRKKAGTPLKRPGDIKNLRIDLDVPIQERESRILDWVGRVASAVPRRRPSQIFTARSRDYALDISRTGIQTAKRKGIIRKAEDLREKATTLAKSTTATSAEKKSARIAADVAEASAVKAASEEAAARSAYTMKPTADAKRERHWATKASERAAAKRWRRTRKVKAAAKKARDFIVRKFRGLSRARRRSANTTREVSVA